MDLINTRPLAAGIPPLLRDVFRHDAALAPTFALDLKQPAVPIRLASFANYMPAMVGQVSRDRHELPDDARCTSCTKGNGKFRSCVQAFRADGTPVWGGACMNCGYSSTAGRCSLVAAPAPASPPTLRPASPTLARYVRIPVPSQAGFGSRWQARAVVHAITEYGLRIVDAITDAAGNSAGAVGNAKDFFIDAVVVVESPR